MILEDATKESFGYYPSELTYGSIKPVIAICENCGTFKKTTKHDYHYLCNSCSKIVGEADKGEKNHNWKPKVNCICEICGNEFKAFPYLVKNGYAKFCGRKCFGIARSKICGEDHPCYGRTYTEEHKANLSRNHADFKGEKSPSWKGGKIERTCEECGKEFYVYPYQVKCGEGKYCSRPCCIKALRGEKAPNWQGGISFEPYCVKFNNVFKNYIRAKFEFKCFLCNKTTEENGRKLDVHHVNYNKDCGCDGDKTCNFVPLCRSCHNKTGTKRDYWEKLITNKLHSSIKGWNV